jgi:glycosyltransferase involved in cell wall biosynthesis
MSIPKKILFVSARLPYPALEGHQIRALGILKQLSKNFDIHLLSLLREGEVIDESNNLGRLCKSISGIEIDYGIYSAVTAGVKALFNNQPLVVTKYVTARLRKNFLQQVEEIKPDIIHLDLLPLAGLIDLIPKGIKVVLNEHNLESDLIRQKLNTLNSFLLKIIYQREYRTLAKFEATVCQYVDLVLACSERDAEGLQNLGAKKVCCIPNGVDAKRLQPDNSNKLKKTLVFLGGMGWYPNRLGIIWFLDEVFPLILKQDPKIILQIIGNPEPFITIPATVNESVERLGFVDDFVPYVQQSTLMIVPLNVGSGTRLKVVEGLALGKCMVSTNKGAEGVGLTHGKDILFADTPEQFSIEVLGAVNSVEKASLIEKNARKLADSVYDWDVIGEKLFIIYKELI